MNASVVRTLGAVAILTGICGKVYSAPAELRFNRNIRPILAENCFPCHGFDEAARKAGLRLDDAEEAYRSRDGVTPIVPGSPDSSEVWFRITSMEADEMMPPPESHLELTSAEKETLRSWIEQGARYEGHWSFLPPQRPNPPGQEEHPGPAIDAFVLERLAEEGLKPSPEASRRTLIRRLSLDLTGLPPSAEETEAFVQDSDPRAYENLAARLLKSPHFGERMALDWLDAARYADTNGFSIDGGRHGWLWRDWVIQSFNDNKPYDRFLVEQLAGDLLPGRSEADLIATGFQRNNMVTHEGGTIPEENLTNYNVDRVKTLGEAVLGLTLGCAQCHDHKFDPITQGDYYSLYAFFNTLGDRGLDGDGGVNPGPSISAKTVLKTDEIPGLRRRIEEIRATLDHRDDGVLAAWEARQQLILAERGRGFAIHPVKALKVSTPNRGAGFEIEEGNRIRIRQAGGLAAFDISAELPAVDAPFTGLRVVMHPQAEFPGGGWGAGRFGRDRDAEGDEAEEKGTFVLTAISLTADAVPGDQVNLHKLQTITRATANSWDRRFPPAGCLDPRNRSGWSPDRLAQGPVHLTATWDEPLHRETTPYLTTQLNFGYGSNMVPGLVELFVVSGTDSDTDLPPDVVEALETPVSQRNAGMVSRLWEHCAGHAEELARLRIELANLEDRLKALTEPFPALVMNVSEKPRETFILTRGDYSQPGERVAAGTPAALPPMPEGAPQDRLGLAQWLVAPEHPLTARVAVNRFWKLFFGGGLVATSADFGAQGEWPSHPKLLDWLAVEFRESGWDVKHLVGLIVASRTYRQSSIPSPELLERDPENRLLARGPRFRLPAEFVRDQALQVSGLLVPRLGGPSVNPYAPGDLWREVSHYGSTPATAQTFVQDHGEKLYRRSIYTYWKRTMPPPNLSVFDAPSREVCTVDRADTTTPLQALVTLNDVQFVEAARAFAQRILTGPGDDAARLRWAFVEALARPPRPEELAIASAALERERLRYQMDAAAAQTFLEAGESPRDSSLPAAEHAAWAQVAVLLLNLSELFTRN